MNDNHWLAERFEETRDHLRGVAYRILGSLTEAEDAVQESWLRLSRSDAAGIENLKAWLTTVVSRVCLDVLRSRKARREESLSAGNSDSAASGVEDGNPERESMLADSVGLALLVVLDALSPAERLAFVLHDMFAVPFDEIAPIVGRSPVAARQLASRAHRRIQGTAAAPAADLARQKEVVDAFLSASRKGDFDALLAILDPDVVLRIDGAAMPYGKYTELRGARAVGRMSARAGAQAARPALVDGNVGVVVAPRGRLLMVLRYTIAEGKIVEIDAVADPDRLSQLELGILPD